MSLLCEPSWLTASATAQFAAQLIVESWVLRVPVVKDLGIIFCDLLNLFGDPGYHLPSLTM